MSNLRLPLSIWEGILQFADNATFVSLICVCKMLRDLGSNLRLMEQRCANLALPHGKYYNVNSDRMEHWVNGMSWGESSLLVNNTQQILNWRTGLQHGPEEVHELEGNRTVCHWVHGQLHGLDYILDAQGRVLKLGKWENDERCGTLRTWFKDNPDELESYSEWKNGRVHGLEQLYTYSPGRQTNVLSKQTFYDQGKPVGWQVIWWPNGQLHQLQHFSLEHQLDGPALWFFETPSEMPLLRMSVYYKGGLEDGPEHCYFLNGDLQSEKHWIGGKLHGRSVIYDISGKLREESSWDLGRPIGIHHCWHAGKKGGGLSQILPHSNGKKNGTEKHWYRYGVLSHVIHWNAGRRDGIEMKFFPDGQIWHLISWCRGFKHGIEQELINGSTVVLVHWHNGLRDGLYQAYYRDGQIETEEEWYVGKLHGKRRTWYEDGQLRSRKKFNNGRKNGHCKNFYPTGQIKKSSHWRNGKREGLRREWYINGQLSCVVKSVGGLRQGYLIAWNQEGEFDIALPFVNGKLHGIGWKANSEFLYFWNDDEINRDLFVRMLEGNYLVDQETGECLVQVRTLTDKEIHEIREQNFEQDPYAEFYDELPNSTLRLVEVDKILRHYL